MEDGRGEKMMKGKEAQNVENETEGRDKHVSCGHGGAKHNSSFV